MGIGLRLSGSWRLRRLVLLAAAGVLVGGCAHVAPADVERAALTDEAYAPALAVPTRDEIFAVTPPMKAYLAREAGPWVARRGVLRGLVDALLADGRLRLDYDASRTRTASEAFDARLGNCLSLVVMTATLAGELGLQVQYQDMDLHVWERVEEQRIDLRIGHVNILLGPPRRDADAAAGSQLWLMVDFLATPQTRARQGQRIDESRIVAMLLNNRAGEALIEGDLRRAYWHARAAVLADPAFAHAWNTLGVVHTRRQVLPAAEAAFRAALARDETHVAAIGNLAGVLQQLGRPGEAAAWSERGRRWMTADAGALHAEGRAALAARDWPRAERFLRRALAASGGWHELHFLLALAYLNQQQWDQALEQLEQAREASTTPALRARYAAKLDALRQPAQAAAGRP